MGQSSDPTRRHLLKGISALGLAGGISTATAGVDLPESAREDIRFMALGDWGRPHDGPASAVQRKVALAMGDWAAHFRPDFVISTGDNIYPHGVSGVHDPVFQSAFEDIYSAASLGCPWFLALGNHDREGRAMAEVAYSARSGRWRMPSSYFLHTEPLPGGGTADFFFLDTTMMIEEASEYIEHFFQGNDDDQLDWLDQTLAASSAVWKIVVGHHPVYSGGHHGSTPELVEFLDPLLRKYGVQAYLNGHDHDLQHVAVDGIHYFTTGGGSTTRPTGAIDGTRFSSSSSGFMMGRLSSAGLAIEFVDADGRPLYATRIEPARHQTAPI